MTRTAHTVTLDAAHHPVSAATVYTDRAEVSRTVHAVTVQGGSGTTEVRLTGVSQKLDQDTIRVENTGTAVLVDVQFKYDMVESADTAAPADADAVAAAELVKTKRAALEALDLELAQLEVDAKLASDQLKVVQQYGKTVADPPAPATTANAAPAQRSAAAEAPAFYSTFLDAYGDRCTALVRERARVRRAIRDKTKDRDDLRTWLAHNDTTNGSAPHKHFVSVSSIVATFESRAPEDIEVDITYTYIVSDAGWSPFYDLRTDAAAKSVQITYAALLAQATGENWTDAEITLSTATVTRLAGKAPEFTDRWEISKRPPPPPMAPRAEMAKRRKSARPMVMAMPFSSSAAPGSAADESAIMDYEDDDEEADEAPPAGAGYRDANVKSGSSLAMTFVLPGRLSVPDGTTRQRANVARFDLPATFVSSTVPKLVPAVYLVAKTTNTSEYTLLPGPCNVFLDGSFINKSTVPLVLPNADFRFSLGTNPAVAVTYKPLERETEKGKAGGVFNAFFAAADALPDGATAIHCTRRIVLENKQADATVQVTVADQVPTSAHASIKVAVLEPDEKKLGTALAKYASTEARDEAVAAAKAKGKAAESPVPSLDRGKTSVTAIAQFADLGAFEWVVNLGPAATHEIVVQYVLQYPKDFKMTGFDE
ncbi:hypothetical protein H9P43_008168 [Blastocladiella emersonii ATCC 22665]|nr:hypothetical protein H9P43_008168 [Blastocladiella emersonii ATCC 22665]